MALLKDILSQVSVLEKLGEDLLRVNKLCVDSREVEARSLFFAIRGVHVDGHQFINQAIKQGAAAVVCEQLPEKPKTGVTFIKVEDSSQACGKIASNFYGNPSGKLKLVGVTGTNGKTTVVTLLYKLFRALGYSCGLLSTVRNKIDEQEIKATHTTPDAIHFNALLAQMIEAGCEYAFAEVSSHAIHQNRIAGIRFAGGVFTNITHDHLDYHKTFKEYLRVKKSFFDGLPKNAFGLSNADDKNGWVMLQNSAAKKCLYGLKNSADYKGKILENNLSGLVMRIAEKEVHFRLTGKFNAYNLLAVYGTALELGEKKEIVLEKLSGITGAEGRFELSVSPQNHLIGIVDYAHTPDALLNVLETIHELREGHNRIFTVVGCGGDRDRTKRPEMGEVAVQNSDQVIFTSDNPRSEDPDKIISEMEKGVPEGERQKILSIANRKEAIKAACSMAQKGDVILIAGKGHEKFQEVKGVKNPFDDKIILNEMFKELNK